MSEPHTPAAGAPSADATKEHVQKVGEETNLGTGNEEPDPATAGNPPDEVRAGDEKREKGGASDTEAETGVGGLG